jgi:hypothetical protein
LLQVTQDKIAEEIVLGLEQEIEDQKDNLVVSICIMAGAVVLFFIVIFSVNRLTKRLQSFAVTLQVGNFKQLKDSLSLKPSSSSSSFSSSSSSS